MRVLSYLGGAKPDDLDAYLWGDTNAGARFTVYFNKKEVPDKSAVLDIDGRNGFGPETITIKQLNSGRYRFVVKNHSENPEITGSHAKVVIAQKDKDGSTKVNQYDIPISGTGIWWEVFEMDGNTGDIHPVGTISKAPPETIIR
ncbi:MAG: hypothetical protein ACL7AX_03960 [Candidatus Arsenophonus phytopathogenicus]